MGVRDMTFAQHVSEVEKMSRKELLHDLRLIGITAHKVQDHTQLSRLFVRSLRSLWKTSGWVEVK